ncbi:hypothetical protein NXX53_06975 [Bacteroides salyersiae]|uniref:hypothetical protein n=1 Tax=Bacteroides TaxID=816 RepID=UPI0018978409|nr:MULTISPECIES: hypothetical protein [Bacteroides]MCS2957021.1 hypothetical protein [Bacteroides salyersiae]
MAVEKSQIKFIKSEQTGELIGFVSRHSRTKKLKGVREGSLYGKKICVLSENLKGKLVENVLYNVELVPMNQGNGYVVLEATPAQFKAEIETIIITKSIYQVCVTFGNKTIFYDPKDGKSKSRKTLEGVLEILKGRKDIEDKEKVIEEFIHKAQKLNERMEQDGFYIKKSSKK